MNTELMLGLLILLLFFYLKNKPRKEDDGFFMYFLKLAGLGILLMVGIGFLFGSFSTNDDKKSTHRSNTVKTKEIATEDNKTTTPQKIISSTPAASSKQKVVDEEPKTGKWGIDISEDPMTDKKKVAIGIDAETPIEGQLGNAVYPSLIIRCKNNHTEAYINWNRFIYTHGHDIHVRIGKQKARLLHCNISTDYEMSFIPHPIPLIKKMFGQKTLLAEVTPYGENPQQVVFDTRGLKEVIKPLRKECHW